MKFSERKIPFWKMYLPLGLYLWLFKPENDNPLLPGSGAKKSIPRATTPSIFEAKDINLWLVEPLTDTFALCYRTSISKDTKEEAVPFSIDWGKIEEHKAVPVSFGKSEKEAIQNAIRDFPDGLDIEE